MRTFSQTALHCTRALHALLVASVMTVASIPTSAHAFEDDVAKAAKAYRQAQQAELAEEYSLAADLYALAYQLAPSSEALRGSMRMALEAERWVLAADRAQELLDKYADDENSRTLANDTLDRARPLVAELAVTCGEVDCTVDVDGRGATSVEKPKHTVFVEPGRHQITGVYPGGSSEPVDVLADAGGSASVDLVAPEGAAIAPVDPNRVRPGGPTETGPTAPAWQRLSPWYFGVAAVATVGVGVGGIISGLQAQRAGDEFYSQGQTQELYDSADKLEMQTNILLGVTGGLAVVTVVLGVFTDWKGVNRGSRRASKKDGNRASLTGAPAMAGIGSGMGFRYRF